MSADDVTPAGFPDARPHQRPAERSQTEDHQPPRFDVMTSSVSVTSLSLPKSVMCPMLLLFRHAVV